MSVYVDQPILVGEPIYIDFVTVGGGGDGEDAAFLIHDQSIALATWTITHSFSYPPHITIIDNTGKVIYTDIEHSNATTAVLTFNAPITGKAILR